ncbi:MAG: NYN domain-containing protein [Silicimonas sp.]|nr:NYN domain-containing protein [Silicimonas sp.]
MTFSSVALLVDGDNIAASYAGQIIRKTENLGHHRVRRAYCNSSSLVNWATAGSFRSVYSGQARKGPNGKNLNASDILLSIDAMHFALADRIEAFAIVTSDSDMSFIACRLRELGHHVTGLGEEKAPAAFRHACDEFIKLTPAQAKVAETKLEPLDRTLREVFAEADPKGQGILLNRLNGLVRRKDPSVKISAMDQKTWPSYLAARTDLYTINGDGSARRVVITAQPD